MVLYQEVCSEEIHRSLFQSFVRHQTVNLCVRREGDSWAVRPDPFIDDWSEEDYRVLIACLKNTVLTGGLVCGAFVNGSLKGFVSVESAPFGNHSRYFDLSSLHVSEDVRRMGIGRELFGIAADWARAHGAEKLYISAHSAVETQAFYRSLGCVEALEYNQAHVEAEPFDCQMEYDLCAMPFAQNHV